MRSNRVAFRRAVFASVGLHLALAVAILLLVQSHPEPRQIAPGIDTRDDNIVMRFFTDEGAIASPPLAAPSAPVPVPSEPSLPTEGGRVDSPASPAGTRPPLVMKIPSTLPQEMLATIRRPIVDPNVKPAAAAHPAVPPIHGALKPRQTVVYVLDCSGSMGEFNKLSLARATLIATLQKQPEGVRFQVIVYNSTAHVIAGAGTVPVNAETIAAAEAKILATEPAGRSNHAAAIRLAVQARPDVILLLSDADDLALSPLKAALSGANKPIALYTAKVSATGIQNPQELR